MKIRLFHLLLLSWSLIDLQDGHELGCRCIQQIEIVVRNITFVLPFLPLTRLRTKNPQHGVTTLQFNQSVGATVNNPRQRNM